MEFFEQFRELSEESRFRAAQELTAEFVELANPVCGDVVQLRVETEDNIVSGLEYRHRGCWPVQGCLELLGQRLVGEPVSVALGLGFADFLGWVESVPTSKRHAFSLTHRAMQQAVLKSLAGKTLVSPPKKGYTNKR